MNLDYEILCYEVKYRNSEFEKWHKEFFSTDEEAYKFWCNIREEFEQSAMHKILTCID